MILLLLSLFTRLEKEYTALKTKENEDQIELRRLRTENRLLRQRIENLEKVEARLLRQNEESATLADKLVQDQVTWAQEVEQTYSLRNELSVTRQQMAEMQKKLVDAEDIIGDIRKRTRLIKETVHLDDAEEENMVKHLQEELIAVRLREAETSGTIRELRQKIAELEDTNLRLQRAPSNDVQQLQEELIAVKLREAEANLSLKELRMKVNEIETYWEAHMERVRQNSPKEKSGKAELRHLQEEVMCLKLKEARAVSDLKDAKQKLMELETQNQICSNQIRRMGDENKGLKEQLDVAAARERELRANIKELAHKLDDTESKRREEAMMSRIRDAECTQQLAELRHRVADIDIQREELLAAGRLNDKGDNQDLENKLYDLKDEVLQLQMSVSPTPGTPRHSTQPGNGAVTPTGTGARKTHDVMTYSFMGDNSDEEVDAEIKDSENLNQTLTDIIEGRSPQHQNHTATNSNGSSDGERDGENLLLPPRHPANITPSDSDAGHHRTHSFLSASNLRGLEERSDDSLDFISDIETNPLFEPDAPSEICSAGSTAGDVSPSVKSVNSCVSHQGTSEVSSHSRATSDSGFSFSEDAYSAKDFHSSLGVTSLHTPEAEDAPGKSSVIESRMGSSARAAADGVSDGKCDGEGRACSLPGLKSYPTSSSSSGSVLSRLLSPSSQPSAGEALKPDTVASEKPSPHPQPNTAMVQSKGFLTEWDLYEEVVVVSNDQPPQVIKSTTGTAAQKSVCVTQQSSPCYKLASKSSTARTALLSVDESQPGNLSSWTAGSNGNTSLGLEAEEDEWSEWQSEIPDVEVIYEPSSGSHANNGGVHEGFTHNPRDNENGFSLKESTV
ncbi:ecotropic viral integration site 5 protein homolog [Elysia marginata]|uniref:Ecotropic viral integration site 5 protein homolog n=1 Tax=Elysia marginata TaxID=1093978 RepID=A0AAV4H3E3_9GAST|nr:ecotropic viral integration site 5 protein homolog [Elysia marginata]